MSLRNYQPFPTTGQQELAVTSAQQIQAGPTNWADPYRPPLKGEVNGEEVIVLQAGDRQGWSTVFLCVGADKQVATVRERDVRITEIASAIGMFLPVEEIIATGRTRQLLNR